MGSNLIPFDLTGTTFLCKNWEYLTQNMQNLQIAYFSSTVFTKYVFFLTHHDRPPCTQRNRAIDLFIEVRGMWHEASTTEMSLGWECVTVYHIYRGDTASREQRCEEADPVYIPSATVQVNQLIPERFGLFLVYVSGVAVHTSFIW